MKIGIPKELKNNEYRVAITPAGVNALVDLGHEIFIENEAGIGSGFTNEVYENEGAKIVDTPEEVWNCDIVYKVKEPIQEEYRHFREDLILFTYLHLAAEEELTKALIENKVTAIAYETVENEKGALPLLTPMSEVAGRMAAQVASHYLTKQENGSGVLLSGIPGVKKGKVTIIGDGVVGKNAAQIALGLGAQVVILGRDSRKLDNVEKVFNRRIQTLISNPFNIAKSVKDSDVVIGAVLIPGAKAPSLVTEEMVKDMKPGSVIVDVAIDQGGIVETADKATTHDNPTYIKHDVVHYAVANIPGAVPKTSTIGLSNATLPYIISLASNGLEALNLDEGFKLGINTYKGYVTNSPVAISLDYEYKPFDELYVKEN